MDEEQIKKCEGNVELLRLRCRKVVEMLCAEEDKKHEALAWIDIAFIEFDPRRPFDQVIRVGGLDGKSIMGKPNG